MQPLLSDPKKQYRRDYQLLRNELSKAFQDQASTIICEFIANWSVFQQAKNILTYMPIKSEVDLRSLLGKHPQKGWILPRIVSKEDHTMSFHEYDPEQLIRHPYGMLEPSATLPGISPRVIDLALVPGIAFDRQGWRLGYGGGFYDHFLMDFAGITLGVTFERLLLKNLPHEKHDIPMKYYVTETELSGAQN